MAYYLQCELNSKYFQLYGEAFIKSFYHHNSGWKLFVADIGLTTAERDLLSQYGTVQTYPADLGRRWNNLTARIYSLADLLQAGHTVIRFDADALILSSYKDLIDSVLADQHVEVAAPQLSHSLAGRARSLSKAAQLLNADLNDERLYKPALTACFMILKPTPRIIETFKAIRPIWPELLAAAKEEEPALSAAIYLHSVQYKYLSWEDFWSVETRPSHHWYTIPCMQPVNIYGKRLRGVHFAYGKYFMLNAAAGVGHEGWGGWQRIIDAYKQLPWPTEDKLNGTV